MSTPRPFFDTAREIRRGQFLEDCADRLQEVVAFVSEHGKAAELTIKIKVKPASKGNGAFWYELQRHDKALEDASKAVIEKIKREAGAAVVFGKPE